MILKHEYALSSTGIAWQSGALTDSDSVSGGSPHNFHFNKLPGDDAATFSRITLWVLLP